MIEAIIEAVSDVYKVTPEQIKGNSRKAPLPEARRMIVGFSRDYKLGYKEIMTTLGISHNHASKSKIKISDEIMLYTTIAVKAAKIHLKLEKLTLKN